MACFQIFKAGILVLTGLLLRWRPEVVNDPESLLYPLLYVATRGKYAALNAVFQGADILPILIFLMGLYLGVIGSGLWQLQKWARRTVMFTSGMTLLLWARVTLLPGIPGEPGSASPDLRNFHLLLMCDALVFVYLMSATTSEAFETKISRFSGI